MTHHAAMNAPIQRCRGDSCHQGRKPCTTPLTCSGASAEIETAIRMHRESMPREEAEPFSSAEAFAWLGPLFRALPWVGAAVLLILCLLAASGQFTTR